MHPSFPNYIGVGSSIMNPRNFFKTILLKIEDLLIGLSSKTKELRNFQIIQKVVMTTTSNRLFFILQRS